MNDTSLRPATAASETVTFKRSQFRNGWTTFNVRDEHADEAERRLSATQAGALQAVTFNLYDNKLPEVVEYSSSYAGQWSSEECVVIDQHGRAETKKLVLSGSQKEALDRGERPFSSWHQPGWPSRYLAWAYIKDVVAALAATQPNAAPAAEVVESARAEFEAWAQGMDVQLPIYRHQEFPLTYADQRTAWAWAGRKSILAAPAAAIDAREHVQRERMNARFANRAKSGATADFDLPGESDAVDAREKAAGLPTAQEPKYTVNSTHIVNRATGEPIPHDEPVFIFRARDKWAATVIGDYAQLVGDPEHGEAIDARFIQFGEWAEAHPERMKEPDTTLAPARTRCEYCDDSGDVHSLIGEWRGVCSCPAGDQFRTSASGPDDTPLETGEGDAR